MLGLGNSLISGVYVEEGGLTLLGTYTSDFASGTDSWGAFGVSAGSQALTANQSVGGVDGALKITYDANETGQFGLELAAPWGEDFEVGDSWEATFKFYSADEDPEDESNFSLYFQAGSGYNGTRRLAGSVADGAWSTVTGDITAISGGTVSDKMRFGFANSGNAPGVGDSWYLKDVVIKHYR